MQGILQASYFSGKTPPVKEYRVPHICIVLASMRKFAGRYLRKAETRSKSEGPADRPVKTYTVVKYGAFATDRDINLAEYGRIRSIKSDNCNTDTNNLHL